MVRPKLFYQLLCFFIGQVRNNQSADTYILTFLQKGIYSISKNKVVIDQEYQGLMYLVLYRSKHIKYRIGSHSCLRSGKRSLRNKLSIGQRIRVRNTYLQDVYGCSIQIGEERFGKIHRGVTCHYIAYIDFFFFNENSSNGILIHIFLLLILKKRCAYPCLLYLIHLPRWFAFCL